MRDRWRGRRLAGLAVAALAVAALGMTPGAARPHDGPALVVRDAHGVELARVSLTTDGFALRYRNSLYGSLVEERYRLADGGIRLVTLAADERSVLEEYYAAFAARDGGHESARTWIVDVDEGPIALPLHIQASRLGERTLLVDGRSVPLWPLVARIGDTSITLSVEGA